ncbi:MAG: STAS domain-containing protein [Actinomycetota bacterium]
MRLLPLDRRIARAAIPVLCERLRLLLEDAPGPIVCDVGALVDPDAVTVDALARLQLTAARLGRSIRFRDVCGELRDLTELMGLRDVLPCEEGSGVEPVGQTEEREQPRRVQEERDPGDPAS